jgi:phosphatidylglycerol---prolipoprotein diacylglyceryl transferase
VLAFVYWNVRPELFQAGPLTVRWYGLCFALAFACGFFIVRAQFRAEGKDEQHLESLLLYMIVGAVLGARLGHVLFYQPGYFLRHPLQLFAVWQGGLASHGGAAGILIALYFYTRHRPEQPYLWLLDRIVVPTALGGAFIRLGNLFNSEILGRPASGPWAFVFVRVDAVPRHPVQLYEAIGYLLICFLLAGIYWRLRARTPRGLLFGLFLASVFSLRFLLEFLKERQADYEQNLPLSVGQWLSLPFIAAGLALLWRAIRHHRRAAGTSEAERGEKR